MTDPTLTVDLEEVRKRHFRVPEAPWRCNCGKDNCDAIKLADEVERLLDRVAEVNTLAFRWMECHDKLSAGEPYTLPSTVDLPDSLAENAQLREALEEATDWMHHAGGCDFDEGNCLCGRNEHWRSARTPIKEKDNE